MPLPPKILSVWGSETGDDFLGSASLLDREHVLTVKHMFVDCWGTGQDLRQRIYVADASREAVTRIRADLHGVHPDHDAAIARLSICWPDPLPPVWMMSTHRALTRARVCLHVVSPELRRFYTVGNYEIGGHDDKHQEWELSPETAQGHSGGVIAIDGEVVGLLFGRTPGQPLARAVCVHDLHDWLRALIPGWVCGSSRLERQFEEGRTRIDTLIQDRPALAALPWSRDNLRPALLHKALADLRRALEMLVEGASRGVQPDLGAIREGGLALIGEVVELAFDREALMAWARTQEIAPFKSAGLAAICLVLARGHKVGITVDGLSNHEFRTRRTAYVEEALTPGCGPDRWQDIGRQFYAQVFPQPQGDAALDKDALEDLKYRIEEATEDDGMPFIVAGKADRLEQVGELQRLARHFSAQAAARTGQRSPDRPPMLLIPEGKLLQSLLLCLEVIQRIR